MANPTPYHVSLDPQTARELATQGASLLFLDLPEGTVMGVDHQVFLTGPKFKGVKMIPPGTHFITYRACSAQSGASPVTGFYLHLAPKQVVIRRWDPPNEMLVPLPDEDEVERYTQGVRRYDFDQGMAPYNLPAYGTWVELSDLVLPVVIERLCPPGGDISIMAEAADAELIQPRTEAERRLMEQLGGGARQQQTQQQQRQQMEGVQTPQGGGIQQQPGTDVDMQGMSVNQGSERAQGDNSHDRDAARTNGKQTADQMQGRGGRCRYTPLPRVVKHAGATPAELTALNLDKTTLLTEVLQQYYLGNMDLLLGELQFAFITFVFGQTIGGYAQWKALLLLLLGCENAPLHTHTSQFIKVDVTLATSMQTDAATSTAAGAVTPFGESLVEELLPDSFLRHMLGNFFSMLHENQIEVGRELAAAATALKQVLKSRLGWDYTIQELGGGHGGSDEDEDGPVVVENPEDWVRL